MLVGRPSSFPVILLAWQGLARVKHIRWAQKIESRAEKSDNRRAATSSLDLIEPIAS